MPLVKIGDAHQRLGVLADAERLLVLAERLGRLIGIFVCAGQVDERLRVGDIALGDRLSEVFDRRFVIAVRKTLATELLALFGGPTLLRALRRVYLRGRLKSGDLEQIGD